MSVCVISTIVLYSAQLVAVSMARGLAERQATQPARGHGDLCGDSPDNSLVCCIGSPRSTLIWDTEECCNGRPVGKNEMCCQERIPVAKAAPSHDSCCLNPNNRQGVTFNSGDHYCDVETGDVVEIPSFDFDFSNSLSNFPDPEGNSWDLSATPDEEEFPPFSQQTPFDRWCLAGNDENRSQGPRWLGENVRCCGTLSSYFASRQTCCAGVLQDMPEEETQCCYQEAYLRGDPRNPCLRRCGDQPLNTENQLCCERVVHPSTSPSEFCCGREKISSDTHLCCGGGILPIGGPNGCCRQVLPFPRRYVRCGRQARLTRKVRGQFQADKLCQRLPTWAPSWPALRLTESRGLELVHIEGQVSQVRKDHHNNVHLTLNPFHVIQSPSSVAQAHVNSACLQGQSIQLVARLGDSAANSPRCRGRELRWYLAQADLMVFFPLNALACSEAGGAIVNVPVASGKHLILLKESQ